MHHLDQNESYTLSTESFALSQVSYPSHVSELESFSEFENAVSPEKDIKFSFADGNDRNYVLSSVPNAEVSEANLHGNQAVKAGLLYPTSSVLSLTGSDLSVGGSLMDLNSPSPSSLLAVDSFLNQNKEVSSNPMLLSDSTLKNPGAKCFDANKFEGGTVTSPFDFPKDLLCPTELESATPDREPNDKCLLLAEKHQELDDSCPDQRPGLDGSSSDSDDDAFVIQRTLSYQSGGRESAHCGNDSDDDSGSLPEVRQLAEGGDVLPDMPGDGGGGGDGSSGHSDSDMDGDGGVSIRASQPAAQPVVSRPLGDPDLRLTAGISSQELQTLVTSASRERERPVGDSFPVSSTITAAAPFDSPRNDVGTSRHGIPFSLQLTASNTNVDSEQDSEISVSSESAQDSRLSGRFFMASSTPATALQQYSVNEQSSWFKDASSFRMSQMPLDEEDETLIADDFQVDLNSGSGDGNIENPNVTNVRKEALGESLDDDNTLSQASELEFEDGEIRTDDSNANGKPHCTTELKTPFLGVKKRNAMLHSTPDFPAGLHSLSMKNCTFDGNNPFDSTLDGTQFKPELKDSMNISYNPFDHTAGGSGYGDFTGPQISDSEFQTICSDPDALFDEDEKNHQDSNALSNIVFASMTDWTVNESNVNKSSLMKVMGVKDPNDKGELRVSWYFGCRSGHLGQLSPESSSERPNFDDSKEIRSPPLVAPVTLLRPETGPTGKFAGQDFSVPNLSNGSETFTVGEENAASSTSDEEEALAIKDSSRDALSDRDEAFEFKRELIGEDSFEDFVNQNSSSREPDKIIIGQCNIRQYSDDEDTIDSTETGMGSDLLPMDSFDFLEIPQNRNDTLKKHECELTKADYASPGRHAIEDITSGKVSLVKMSGLQISELATNLASETKSDSTVMIKLLFRLQESEKRRRKAEAKSRAAYSVKVHSLPSAPTSQNMYKSKSISASKTLAKETDVYTRDQQETLSNETVMVDSTPSNSRFIDGSSISLEKQKLRSNQSFSKTMHLSQAKSVSVNSPRTSQPIDSPVVYTDTTQNSRHVDVATVKKETTTVQRGESSERPESIVSADKQTFTPQWTRPVSSVLPLQAPSSPVKFRDCASQCDLGGNEQGLDGLPPREKSYESRRESHHSGIQRIDACVQSDEQIIRIESHAVSEVASKGKGLSPTGISGKRDESIVASSLGPKSTSDSIAKEVSLLPFLNSTAFSCHANYNQGENIPPLAEVRPLDKGERGTEAIEKENTNELANAAIHSEIENSRETDARQYLMLQGDLSNIPVNENHANDGFASVPTRDRMMNDGLVNQDPWQHTRGAEAIAAIPVTADARFKKVQNWEVRADAIHSESAHVSGTFSPLVTELTTAADLRSASRLLPTSEGSINDRYTEYNHPRNSHVVVTSGYVTDADSVLQMKRDAGERRSKEMNHPPISIHEASVVDGYQTLPIQGQLRQVRVSEPSIGIEQHSNMKRKPTPTLPNCIVVDEDVMFNDIQCVGVSANKQLSLHNASSRWMQCRIKCDLYSVNGSKVDPERGCAFVFQERVIVQPHTTEQVKVKFHPKVPGIFLAKLSVTSRAAVPSAENLDNAHVLPQYVHVEGVAELPNVEIFQEDSQIDFGEVSYGSSRSRPIRMINRGQSSVPIRMIISASSTVWPCFSFVNSDSSPRGSPVGKAPLSEHIGSPPMLSFTLDGRTEIGKSEPYVVWVQFKAPIKQEKESKTKLGPPVEFSARVDLEVHGKGTDLILGSVLLKTLVGVAKLRGSKDLRAVTLSTIEGQRVSRSVELRNAGNISMHVNLKFKGGDGLFAVLPDKIVLRPHQKTEIFIHFESPSPILIDSSLLLLVHPDGPCHEIHVRGMATAKKTVSDEGQALFCNKPVLCWAGVQLGLAKQQRLTLRNNTTHSDLKLSLTIQGGHSDFQIQNAFGTYNEDSKSLEVVLKPQEDFYVYILFIPSCFGMISSALVIQSIEGGTKYKIPLYGYGGTSQVVPVNVRKSDQGYWYKTEKMAPGKMSIIRISLRNNGTKDAFVKAVCFSDLQRRILYPKSLISIPDDFILPEKTSKELVMLVRSDSTAIPLDQNKPAPDKPAPFFYLVLYTGDEWLRQLYTRKCSSEHDGYPEIREGRLQGLSFTKPFAGEDRAHEDVLYPELPNWESFFQSCVSQTVIAVAEGNSALETRSGNITRTKTPDMAMNELITATPIARLPVMKPDSQVRTERRGRKEAKKWDILPDRVTLTISPQVVEKRSSKVHLVNHTLSPLRFQFFWPVDVLDIIPSDEMIPPKSQLAIIISVKSKYLSSGHPLPWQGNVFVHCNNEQKSITVQIRQDISFEGSPYGGLTRQGGKLNSLAISHTPAPDTSYTDMEVFSVHPRVLFYKDVVVKSEKVECIYMQNNVNEVVRWLLSSVAPTYLKTGSTNDDIFRVTYSAFRFNQLNGTLLPGEGTQVNVVFRPRDCGLYSQYWDVRVSLENGKVISKVRLQLDGECSPNQHGDVMPPFALKQVGRAQPIVHSSTESLIVTNKMSELPPKGDQKKPATTGKSGHNRGIFVKEDHLQFPPTAKGSESKAEFRLCNDTEDIQRARLSGVRTPFHLKHFKVAIKPKSFVRVPVFFSPTDNTNSLESLLVITTEIGVTLCVKLSGKLKHKKLTGKPD